MILTYSYLPEGYVMDVVFFTPTTGVKSDGKGNLYLEIILFIN